MSPNEYDNINIVEVYVDDTLLIWRGSNISPFPLFVPNLQ